MYHDHWTSGSKQHQSVQVNMKYDLELAAVGSINACKVVMQQDRGVAAASSSIACKS